MDISELIKRALRSREGSSEEDVENEIDLGSGRSSYYENKGGSRATLEQVIHRDVDRNIKKK